MRAQELAIVRSWRRGKEVSLESRCRVADSAFHDDAEDDGKKRLHARPFTLAQCVGTAVTVTQLGYSHSPRGSEGGFMSTVFVE